MNIKTAKEAMELVEQIELLAKVVKDLNKHKFATLIIDGERYALKSEDLKPFMTERLSSSKSRLIRLK